MRRSLALGLIVAVLSGVFAATPVQASVAHCGYWMLETFHIEAATTKKTYARGSTLVFKVNVTRPAHRDPADLGVEWGEPPASVAASGVEVSAAFWYGKRYLYNKGVTDGDGNTTIKVPVPAAGPAGPIDVDFSARLYYNRGGCPDGEEMGYRTYPKMVTLT